MLFFEQQSSTLTHSIKTADLEADEDSPGMCGRVSTTWKDAEMPTSHPHIKEGYFSVPETLLEKLNIPLEEMQGFTSKAPTIFLHCHTACDPLSWSLSCDEKKYWGKTNRCLALGSQSPLVITADCFVCVDAQVCNYCLKLVHASVSLQAGAGCHSWLVRLG